MAQVASVILPPLEEAYSYLIPAELCGKIVFGSRVEVPIGKRSARGFVVAVDLQYQKDPADKFTLRAITRLLYDSPCFNEEQFRFFNWIADYYGENLSRVFEIGIPEIAPRKFSRSVELLPKKDSTPKGTVQKKILSIIEKEGGILSYSSIIEIFKNASSSLKSLETQGFIRILSTEIKDQHLHHGHAPDWAKREIKLNPEQDHALDQILQAWKNREFKPFLLYGITGSGKTEVYIEALRHVRDAGQGVLVIVPEIALTPQLIDRFRARLGNEIAVLHSAMSKRARWDSWLALLEGRNTIAIGARSAVFAPIKNLGLIVVDEEHDASFKQGENLRYNARDLAVLRAKLNNCPVVLGSATPSLESFSHSEEKKYAYLELPSRHSVSFLPSVEIVDLNSIKPWMMPTKNISPQLLQALKDIQLDDSQAFILYNRRGFATFLQCDKCNEVLECPHCSVTLTYHQNSNSLLCHYCNYSTIPPSMCNKCPKECLERNNNEPGTFVRRGAGTEKVLEEIQGLLPHLSVERLDRDAVENLAHYRKILTKVRDGETKILVGTQMIAKGHDLPNVTLVGVIDCDVGLHFPDFRASERVFQLLTQASGRAGRGDKPGRVILQTRVPHHPSLQKTLTHDFPGFARLELKNRKALRYPPFTRLLRIVVASLDQRIPPNTLLRYKEVLFRYRDCYHSDLSILGPAPAPLAKIKTLWRWHMLLKSGSPTILNQCIHMLREVKASSKKARIIFDMDPQDML